VRELCWYSSEQQNDREFVTTETIPRCTLVILSCTNTTLSHSLSSELYFAFVLCVRERVCVRECVVGDGDLHLVCVCVVCVREVCVRVWFSAKGNCTSGVWVLRERDVECVCVVRERVCMGGRGSCQ